MNEADKKTIWCGNLPDHVSEEILYELFLQAGPLVRVNIAKDREGRQKNFAFITYSHEVSVPYALNLFQGTSLFHRSLTLQSRGPTALLPPPIRFGPEPEICLSNHQLDVQQFSREHEEQFDNSRQWAANDKLTMASLQGNWTHRHHPYRTKELSNSRDSYRSRENNNSHRSREKPWRDRRHHKKPKYH